MILRILTLLACLCCFGAQANPLFPDAQGQTITITCVGGTQYQGIGGPGISTPCPTYTGPGDIVSGATVFYGLRAYNAAAALPGTTKAVNVRRASDNANLDILILPDGNLDVETANAFAGVDANGNGTAVASTTIAIAGASSTPHVGSTITGPGIVQPCVVQSVGTFVAGAGNVVVNAAQTVTAAALTFTYGLYVTEWYDQSGNGSDLTQPTGANQPQILPNAGDGLPGVVFDTNIGFDPATIASSNLTYLSAVVERTTVTFYPCALSQYDEYLNTVGNNLGWYNNFPNSARLDGSGDIVATMSDGTFHAMSGLLAGASSVLNIDGSETTGNAGSGTPYTKVLVGGSMAGGVPVLANNMKGIVHEAAGWVATPGSTTRAALVTNIRNYYGTP